MRKIMGLFLIVSFLLVSCSYTNVNNSKKEPLNLNIEGIVSTIYYQNLENVKLIYENNYIGETNVNGVFNVNIEFEDLSSFSLSKLKFELDGYVFAIAKSEKNNNYCKLIVKANFDECKPSWADVFYSVGGKVVYHYDGETPLVGAKILIDGIVVKVIDEDGNFDLEYVVKGSKITVEYDGYKFVDITGSVLNVIIDSNTYGLTFRAVEKNA
ncbi:MAG: hypothetical protein ACI35S_01095 [Anaeroplasma sp.]